MCLTGRRACPPEDVGGIYGYCEFLEVIGDAGHPEREEMLEWIGGDFVPAEFDLKETNEALEDVARNGGWWAEIDLRPLAAFAANPTRVGVKRA